MPLYKENHVKIEGGITVWDGITRPETLEATAGKSGGQKWNVKIVVPPNNPDIDILNQLANAELSSSEFQGQLPNGGIWPIGTAGPNEFGGGFQGWSVINCSTYRHPEVFDENGQMLQPMQYGGMMYTGQRVDVVVHCKAYNNKSKGIAARLDGFQIIASANSPKLAIGGCDTSGAFGGGGGGQQNNGGGYQDNNQNQNNGGGGQQQNGGGYQQQNNGGGGGGGGQQQNGGGYQDNNQNQNNGGGGGGQQQNGGGQQNNGGQPRQAHDFLPDNNQNQNNGGGGGGYGPNQ